MIVNFASARGLLARAKWHREQLERHVTAYKMKNISNLGRLKDHVTGFEERRYKVKDKVPLEIAFITFDVVNELRSSLDYCVYEAVRMLTGKDDPSSTKFPFGDSYLMAERQFNGKAKDVPISIRDYLLEFGPFPKGDRYLWPLNKIRNRKIHRTIAVMATKPTQFSLGGDGAIDYLEYVNEWDEEKKELTYLRGRNISDGIEAIVRIDVAFTEDTPLAGEPLLGSLADIHDIVENVVLRLESETARLLRKWSV
jgi:hypothetical protein